MKLFSIEELFEIWYHFFRINWVFKRADKINEEAIKKLFNSKIELYSKKPGPQNDFYLKNYVDYLDELEKKNILKRCRNCNKAFNFKEKKRYCNSKCARAAQNWRGYQRFMFGRRKRAKILIRKSRLAGSYIDKRKKILY